jgi:phosphatidate cytidylyltransferase
MGPIRILFNHQCFYHLLILLPELLIYPAMLLKRVFAATCMIALLTACLWLDVDYFHDSLMLHALFLIGVFFSFREFWPLCRATGHQTFSIWGTFCGCALVLVNYWTLHLATPGTVEALKQASNLFKGALAVSILGTFVLTAKRSQFSASLGGVAVTCLGLFYIYFLPSFVLSLRHLNPHTGLIGGPVEDWNVFGHKMVVATIVLAKGCDVWAYLAGRMLGKHKAFPRLSPGKTVEGVVAGLAGSVLASIFLWWDQVGVLPHNIFSLKLACLLGFCIGLAGMMGDLAESLLKRSAGAKDAGTIVPGYGGAMDVVDSLMVAGPVAYFLISAII